jgi:hypothetical protein
VTLCALGADCLIMDLFSELGPLDIQLYRPNELWGRKSGLLSRSAFESLAEASFETFEQILLNITVNSHGLISFKLASEVAAGMAAQMMAPVYGQLNPDIIGSDHRDTNIALEYGTRLALMSKNTTHQAVRRLVRDYPSHDFIIDDIEARELLKRIEKPAKAKPTTKGESEAQSDAHEHQQGGKGSQADEGAVEPMDSSGRPDRSSDPGTSDGGDGASAGQTRAGDGPTGARARVRPKRPQSGLRSDLKFEI